MGRRSLKGSCEILKPYRKYFVALAVVTLWALLSYAVQQSYANANSEEVSEWILIPLVFVFPGFDLWMNLKWWVTYSEEPSIVDIAIAYVLSWAIWGALAIAIVMGFSWIIKNSGADYRS